MDKSVSIADVVFDKIEREILNGTFARGEIVSELKLCAMLGVSRTPIREALTRLRQEGLVEESGKGARVIGITKNDIIDIYDVRVRIEGLAASRCAENMNGERLKKLKENLDLQQFYTEKGSADAIKNLDSEFHKLIYAYTDSAILESLLSELHRKAQRFRKVSVENSERAIAAVKEHIEIYEAIKQKNAKQAERLMIDHIENAKRSIIRLYDIKTIRE